MRKTIGIGFVVNSDSEVGSILNRDDVEGVITFNIEDGVIKPTLEYQPTSGNNELSYTNFQTILEFPVFEGLTYLDCSECISLEKIPPWNSIRTLSCRNCVNLENISELPYLESISMDGCSKIKTIPEFPRLETLSIRDCCEITCIPKFRRIERINCSGCLKLEEIEGSRSLRNLQCGNCPSLRKLPEIHGLHSLICDASISDFKYFAQRAISRDEITDKSRSYEVCDFFASCSFHFPPYGGTFSFYLRPKKFSEVHLYQRHFLAPDGTMETVKKCIRKYSLGVSSLTILLQETSSLEKKNQISSIPPDLIRMSADFLLNKKFINSKYRPN